MPKVKYPVYSDVTDSNDLEYEYLSDGTIHTDYTAEAYTPSFLGQMQINILLHNRLDKKHLCGTIENFELKKCYVQYEKKGIGK